MNTICKALRSSRTMITIQSRNSSTYNNKRPLVNINVNVRCKADHDRDLKKYIEYRKNCWKEHYTILNMKKNKNIRKTVIKEFNDLNDWETKKANEHTFKN